MYENEGESSLEVKLKRGEMRKSWKLRNQRWTNSDVEIWITFLGKFAISKIHPAQNVRSAIFHSRKPNAKLKIVLKIGDSVAQ